MKPIGSNERVFLILAGASLSQKMLSSPILSRIDRHGHRVQPVLLELPGQRLGEVEQRKFCVEILQ